MRNLTLPITLLAMLLLIQSAPVAGPSFAQPFPPRQPPILNGCSENALFAILRTGEGKYCLDNLLPRASNTPSEYSIFCSGGQWGCCLKQAGMSGCKVRGQIPYRRLPQPPRSPNP